MKNPFNILTIDVEDYFQVENFKSVIKTSDWPRYECRIEPSTEKILSLLEKHHAKATFFILGWIAEHYPSLVKKIQSAGHEVASHGYAHQLVYLQSREEFRSDVRKAKKILEEITGVQVDGYRAPSYSIRKDTLWALDVLREEGYRYDSSIFPIRRDRGGIHDALRYPHPFDDREDSLWEFPISTVRIFHQNLSFAGGGYFRLFPYSLIRWSIQKMNQEGYPSVVYLHPWEFDPGQPKVRGVNFLNRFRHYVNLGKTQDKLERMLNGFRFTSIREFSSADSGAAP